MANYSEHIDVDGFDERVEAASRSERNRKRSTLGTNQSPILVILVALIAAVLVFIVVPFDRSAEMYVDGEYGRDVVTSENTACVLEETSAVHCYGMRWPIDVVYLYDSNVIFVETVEPGNLGTQGIPANKIVELPAGQAAALGLSEGSHVTFA